MMIDCHCHTIYSKHWFWGYDALNNPREVIKAAIKKGLNGIAITDHNTVKGSLVAKKISKSFKGFKIITGSEIRTKEGEILGLGIKKDVPINLSLREAIEKVHDLGGIAVAPHPFGSYTFRRCVREKAVKADVIEVFNSTLYKGANKKALILAEKFKKAKTAGSDAHSIREIGNAGIICSGDPIEDVLKRRVELFGRKTSVFSIARLTTKKFIRSAKWRISGKRGKHI